MAAFEYGLYVILLCISTNQAISFLWRYLQTLGGSQRKPMKLFERPWCNKAPTEDIATTEAIACKDPEVVANALRFNIP